MTLLVLLTSHLRLIGLPWTVRWHGGMLRFGVRTLSWSRRLNSSSTRLAVHDVDAGPVFQWRTLRSQCVRVVSLDFPGDGRDRVAARHQESPPPRCEPTWSCCALDGWKGHRLQRQGERRFVTTLPSKRLAASVGKSLALISAGETGIVLIESERKPLQARALGAEALSLLGPPLDDTWSFRMRLVFCITLNWMK